MRPIEVMVIKQMLSPQKAIMDITQLDDQKVKAPRADPFSKKWHFFSIMHRIYWYALLLLVLIAGSSVYYFSVFSFSPIFSIKRVLPNLEPTKIQTIARVSEWMKGIQWIPFQLDRLKNVATSQTIKNTEKPIVTILPHAPIETQKHSKIVDLEKNSASIKNKVNHFSSQMNNIEKQLTHMSQQLQELEAKLKDKSSDYPIVNNTDKTSHSSIQRSHTAQEHENRISNLSIESVHAIIRGRAWLNSQEGHMISVGLGSYVPDYGVVSLIDPARGLIQFNSGKLIYLNKKEY